MGVCKEDLIDEEGRREGIYRPHGRNRGVRQAQANARWVRYSYIFVTSG